MIGGILLVNNSFRQAMASYPYNGDVMFDSKKNFVLSTDEKKRLTSDIKIGIYKELNSKSLLSNGQLSFLLEKENNKNFKN